MQPFYAPTLFDDAHMGTIFVYFKKFPLFFVCGNLVWVVCRGYAIVKFSVEGRWRCRKWWQRQPAYLRYTTEYLVLSHDNMQPFYAPNNRCMGIHDSNITKNTRKNWHWNLKKWCYAATRKKIHAARQKLHTAYIMIGMYLSRTNTSAVTSTQTCRNFAETVQ